MADVSVPISLDLQIKDAVDQAAKAADAVSKEFEKVSANTKASANATNFIAGFLVADKIIDGIKSLANAVGDMVKEAAEAEKVSIGMANALRVSGDYSDEAAQQFQDLAESIAEVTKFDDDLILSQVKVAKQFNTSNAEATKLIKASVQLATVLDVDLTTATNLLGKTLDGTAGRLNETVPGLRNFSKEALASGAAIDYVLKRFAGSAESDVKTFGGAMAQLNKAMEDAGKAVGALVVKNESFVKIIELVTKVFRELESLIKANDETIGAFVNASLKTMVDLFGILALALVEVDKIFTLLLIPLNIVARTIQFVVGGLASLLTLDLKGLANNLNIIGNVTKDNRAQNAAFEARKKTLEGIAEAAAKASNYLDDQLKTTKDLGKADAARASSMEDTSKAAARLQTALREEQKAFEEQVDKMGTSQLENIAKEYTAALRKNYELFKNTSKYAELDYQIRRAYDKKLVEENERLLKERLSKLQTLVSQPFSDLFNSNGNGNIFRDGAFGDQNANAARGVGAAANVLQGRQGAVTLLSGVAEAAGQAFLGIPGIGQLFSLLAQGPEQVKAMVKEFIKSLPEIIVAVAESIPAIIDGIIEALPQLIEGIIKALPRIAIAMARTFILYMPEAIYQAVSQGFVKFFDELYKGAVKFVDAILAGAGQFIQALIQGIGDGIASIFEGLNPLNGGSGSIGKGIIGSIPGLNLLDGVDINDFIPGGGFLPDLGNIFNWKGGASSSLDGGGFQKSGASSSSMMGQKPMQVSIQIGQRQLATAIFDLNRQGFRTS